MKYLAGLLVALLSTTTGVHQAVNAGQYPLVRYAMQQPATPPAAASALDLVSGYRDAVSKLQSSTKVPLSMPMWVPYDDDKSNPLFASVQTANPGNYQLELAWIEDCNFAGACHVGYISGSTSSLLQNKGPKVPVTLKGGIQGYFVDAGCGANCDDSAIYWASGGYHYAIGMKAETQDTLVKMANSAIGVQLK
jgi:hypothetical protein